jgi:hypothetical protein
MLAFRCPLVPSRSLARPGCLTPSPPACSLASLFAPSDSPDDRMVGCIESVARFDESERERKSMDFGLRIIRDDKRKQFRSGEQGARPLSQWEQNASLRPRRHALEINRACSLPYRLACSRARPC